MENTETDIRILFSRNKEGIVITVKTNDMVENFMRSLGAGDPQDVTAYGAKWGALDRPLLIYPGDMNTIATLSEGARYRLDMPGSRLDLAQDFGAAVYNLSFFRLVGISQPGGVRFLLKNTVMGKDGLLDMRDKLVSYSKQLYTDFIRPIEAEGSIYRASTQETYL